MADDENQECYWKPFCIDIYADSYITFVPESNFKKCLHCSSHGHEAYLVYAYSKVHEKRLTAFFFWDYFKCHHCETVIHYGAYNINMYTEASLRERTWKTPLVAVDVDDTD